MVLDMNALEVAKRQQWLQALIVPRPIGLVSTISDTGIPNLAPFSFFNLFSANPPIVIFSPARRVRDNTCKHTMLNLEQVPEVVISLVDYAMVHQVIIAGADYGQDVNEFIKAGFGMEAASRVKPFMVKESKVQFECSVTELKSLGREAGAGTLVICEVLHAHISDCILDNNGKPDYGKFQPVARLGDNWYCEIKQDRLFEIKKTAAAPAGIDQLPAVITTSAWLNKRHHAQLASVAAVAQGAVTTQPVLHVQAANLLNNNRIDEAWEVLMTNPLCQ